MIPKRTLPALLMLWAAASAPHATAEDMEMTPGARDMPNVVPGKQEAAESVFAKLDAGKKGFITLADVAVLPGFDRVFQSADDNHDGKLSPKEFKQAWTAYSGVSDPAMDAPGVR